MLFRKSKFLILILILSYSHIIIGQEDLSSSQNIIEKDSSYVLMGINFISDAVYMGRKDSISAPYLYPLVTYHHKSGFYSTGSLSYLTKSNESRIDLFLITAGFDFTIKNFDGDISITKYFFNTDSYNVISEVDADVTANFTYDFNIINLSLTATNYFNNDSSSDFFLSPEISQDFITRNEKFQFSPTIGIHFGSQNFYEQYYIYNRFGNGNRQGQGSGSGNGLGPGNGSTVAQPSTTTSISINESEKFDLLAIEFSLPIWYMHKSFMVSFLPTYIIPQTPATLTVNDMIYEEDLKNTFYWVLGIHYMF